MGSHPRVANSGGLLPERMFRCVAGLAGIHQPLFPALGPFSMLMPSQSPGTPGLVPSV